MIDLLDSAAQLVDSNFGLGVLLPVWGKSLLILLAFGAILFLLRTRSAALRHLIRCLALLSLIVLPFLSLLLPVWQLNLLPEPREAVAATSIEAAVWTADLSPVAGDTHYALPLSEEDAKQAPVSDQRGGTDLAKRGPDGLLRYWGLQALESLRGGLQFFVERWALLLTLLWIAGTTLILSRLLLSFFCVGVATRHADALSEQVWNSLFFESSRLLGLRRNVRLLTSSKLEVALSVGLWRPAILIPAIGKTWSIPRRRSILLHELAHVQRRDNLTNLLSQLACALYWFNPLVWKMAAGLVTDRERACDDCVLRAGTRATDYAGHLLQVARAVSLRRFWGQLEISQASALKNRVADLLNPALDRRAAAPRMAVAGIAFSLLLTAPLSALQPWYSGIGRDAAQGTLQVAGTASQRHVSSGNSGVDSGPPIQGTDAALAASNFQVVRDESLPSNGIIRSSLQRSPSGNIVIPDLRSGNRKSKVSGSATRRLPQWYAQASEHSDTSGIPPGALLGSQFRRFAPVPEDPATPLPPGDDSTVGDEDVFDPVSVEVIQLDLGTLGGRESFATAINDRGQVVGQSRKGSGVVNPFLWSSHTGMIDLGNPLRLPLRAIRITSSGKVLCETFGTGIFRGFLWTEEDGMVDLGALDSRNPVTIPRAMNSLGQVVGSSRDASGQTRAFFWSAEHGMLDLGAPGRSEALDINDLGQVVGQAAGRAFLWSLDAGLQMVGPSAALTSVATGLNNRGQIVGYAELPQNLTRGFWWGPGEGAVDLGSLDLRLPVSLPVAINGKGHVVGFSRTADADATAEVRAFRWTREGGLRSLGRAAPQLSLAINESGQVVGTYTRQSERDSLLAFVWSDAGVLSLTSGPVAQSSTEAVAINNNGQIVGSALTTRNERHAFLWEIRAGGAELSALIGVPQNSSF